MPVSLQDIALFLCLNSIILYCLIFVLLAASGTITLHLSHQNLMNLPRPSRNIYQSIKL